jgi:3-oxoacyl-[acyl-carrier protein] reductase
MLKKVLVTGSTRGIGRAITLNLAHKGYDVVVHYRQSDVEAKEVTLAAQAYGVKAVAIKADLTHPEEARYLVDTTAEVLGGLSVVVNNVGNYLKKAIDQVNVEEWHEILGSNLNATFYVTQAALPYLKTSGYGRIINLGFAGAQDLVARPLITPYVIAKTGIVLYTKSLAKQLIQDGVTVNVVAPGVVETSISKPVHEIPCARLATLKEIVSAVDFFLDENSAYLTGQVVEVAGGWNL